MNQQLPTENEDLELAIAIWKLLRRHSLAELEGSEDPRMRELVRRRLHAEREAPSDNEMEGSAWEFPLSHLRPKIHAQGSDQNCMMTVARFVECKFVPEHVNLKRPSGRTYYQSMLKHVLKPEEVDRVFRANLKKPARQLSSLPGWPYLGDVRLCDIRPDHVDRLISAALDRGYSTHTATNLRNVVSAIFSHAIQERCFTGGNPVKLAKLQLDRCKGASELTLDQARRAISVMQYPEKEMTLLAIFTGMSPAEIYGLQWKRVNLTRSDRIADGKPVPSRTIAVRKQWNRGKLENVIGGRIRNLPIPPALLPIFLELGARTAFSGPDDFVLVSKVGAPINQNALASRLRSIARKLEVPSLSWRVLHRTWKALAAEFGVNYQDITTMDVHPVTRQDSNVRKGRRCRDFGERTYSERDLIQPFERFPVAHYSIS